MRWSKAADPRFTSDVRLEPPCSVFIDLCGGELWRLKMDGKLELLGHADQRLITALLSPLLKSLRPSSTPDLLSLAEVAARTGFARKTLYEWKRTGKLRREHGLRTVNGTPRIDWQLFKASLDKGELF